MLVLAVLIMLNVIASGFLLSRARGERAVESISTQSVSLAECRLAPIRQQPPVREAVRWRRGRPFRWTMWPTPAGPLKPYESKVRTAVEQTPCCGCSAGKRQVVGLPGAREDRPIGPVHYLCRVWAAGALPASRAGPGLRRDVQTFCAIDQGADRFPVALQVTASVMDIFVICRPADEPKRIHVEPALLTYLTEEPPARPARRRGRAS